MKWKCAKCSKEQPCILEIKAEPEQIDPPDNCPYGEVHFDPEWNIEED